MSLAALTTISLLMPCHQAAAHNGTKHERPDPLQVAAKATELQGLLENLELKDQNGETFRIAELKGKPVLVNFMFTDCPDVCGLQTLQLRELQQKLSSIDEALRPRILSITLNPSKDTSDVLKAYGEKFSVDQSDWLFASGSQDAVTKLASVFWVGSKTRDDGQIDHRMIIHMLDAQLELVQRYKTNPLDVEHISAEIHRLIATPG